MSTARRSAARASRASRLRAAEAVALSILLVVFTIQPGPLTVAASARVSDPNAPDFAAVDAHVEAQVKGLASFLVPTARSVPRVPCP